jgi:ankyrin repeat protein
MKYFILVLLFTSHLAFCQQTSPDDALTIAASANDVAGMKRALGNGADINSAPYGSGGRTPLMQAVTMGSLDAVRFLIEKKADLNRKDMGGRTALIYAAGLQPEIATALIKAGADVNVKDKLNYTALLNETKPEIKKLMKDAGAKEIKWENPWAAKPKPSPALSATASPIQSSPAK